MTAQNPEAGFTLVEMLVAIVIYAMLAIAGVGVVVTEHTWGSAWSTRDSGAQFREDFVSAVVREVATDIATREIDPMKRNVARAALTRALQALPAVQALKKDEAKKLGLMMSDYRDYTDGKKVVILPIERNVDEPARSKGNVLGLDGES